MKRPKNIGIMTVLLIRGDGRSTLGVRVPYWVPAGLRSGAVVAVLTAAFIGWQMQALFGLTGPRVELAALSGADERYGMFERLAPESDGPTRSELARRSALSRAARLGLGDRRAASLIWMGTLEPAWRQDADRASHDGTLLWPVQQGLFGRGFGSGEGGYHMAIDIDGPRGSDVLAAAAGTVGYAGHELRGYGNMIMIMHAGGWVTLYGHNQRLLVVPGEHVARGQAIAELGSTGRSMGPHVHFELVHDGVNCDPLPLFRYETANGPERMPQAALATWLPDGPRPKSVRCTKRRPHPMHDKSDPESMPDDGSSEPIAAN